MPETLTLSMLGGLESNASGVPVSAADRKKLLNAVREAAKEDGLATYNLEEPLLKFVGESLRKPLAGILGEAWRQRKELREFAEKGKERRDIVGRVELFEHTISWTLRPSVSLYVNGVNIRTVKFTCKADLKLKVVELVIKNAWITEIRAGKLSSTITLKYGEFPLMAPCKKEYDLPLSLDLPGGGIRLGGESTAR